MKLKFLWVPVLAMGLLPAISQAGGHFRFSLGVGIGFPIFGGDRWGYGGYGYGGGYCAPTYSPPVQYYAPPVVYSAPPAVYYAPTYYAPPPVYYAPSATYYQYSAPPVYCQPSVRYYYGR